MLGLRPPDKGKISLKFPTDKESKLTNEGFDVENIMRDIFSYVPQKPFFFAGTILENLIYPSILDVKLNTYNKRKIYHALKIVSMDSLINKLGLDFRIGDSGEGLSTGQLQRLGIARAILNEKKFIILDECTSNLDENTENQIIDNLNSLTNSCIVHITHKSSVVKKVDKVIRIVNGQPELIQSNNFQ